MALLEKTYSLPRPVVTAVISDVVRDFASVKKMGQKGFILKCFYLLEKYADDEHIQSKNSPSQSQTLPAPWNV